MARQQQRPSKSVKSQKAKSQPQKQQSYTPPHSQRQSFHLDFKNQAQKMAWGAFDKHDVLFLLGPAGVGKSHLAVAFAINEILAKKKKKIILTRPVVEAGESLGFLPGTFEEKINPYILPLLDCIERCVGKEGPQREAVDRSIEVAPLAYMRGRTFNDAVCIFDESQNATASQIKLFMTRFGENSKIIITGDPNQSDLPYKDQGLMSIVNKLEDLSGIGVINFKANSIVRHPLIASILERLEGKEEKEEEIKYEYKDIRDVRHDDYEDNYDDDYDDNY